MYKKRNRNRNSIFFPSQTFSILESNENDGEKILLNKSMWQKNITFNTVALIFFRCTVSMTLAGCVLLHTLASHTTPCSPFFCLMLLGFPAFYVISCLNLSLSFWKYTHTCFFSYCFYQEFFMFWHLNFSLSFGCCMSCLGLWNALGEWFRIRLLAMVALLRLHSLRFEQSEQVFSHSARSTSLGQLICLKWMQLTNKLWTEQNMR